MLALKHDGFRCNRMPPVDAAIRPRRERLEPNAEFPPDQISSKVFKICKR